MYFVFAGSSQAYHIHLHTMLVRMALQSISFIWTQLFCVEIRGMMMQTKLIRSLAGKAEKLKNLRVLQIWKKLKLCGGGQSKKWLIRGKHASSTE